MAERTSGPWAYDRNDGSLRGPDGLTIARFHCGRDDHGNDARPRKADAALIAAAPDLYEACKAFMRAQSGPRDNDVEIALWDEAITAIDAAIAKVEGR